MTDETEQEKIKEELCEKVEKWFHEQRPDIPSPFQAVDHAVHLAFNEGYRLGRLNAITEEIRFLKNKYPSILEDRINKLKSEAARLEKNDG